MQIADAILSSQMLVPPRLAQDVSARGRQGLHAALSLGASESTVQGGLRYVDIAVGFR